MKVGGCHGNPPLGVRVLRMAGEAGLAARPTRERTPMAGGATGQLPIGRLQILAMEGDL